MEVSPLKNVKGMAKHYTQAETFRPPPEYIRLFFSPASATRGFDTQYIPRIDLH
jgi:hypothetical protein